MRFLEAAFARSNRMVGRRIGEEYVLVPIVSHGADLDGIFSLNRVATFIWEQLDGRRTGAQIVQALTQQFEVDESGAARDYSDLIAQLQSIQAVERSDETR